VKPSRPKRRFTLAQANSSLPLVRRIVSDIVRTHAEALKAQSDLKHLPSGKSQQEVQGRLESHLEHLEDFVDELTEVGCELKDYRMGLIDFTGRHKGRDVCLCWKLDEPTVGYWHEMDAGFSGRQPIGTLRETD
jgi:hypothetical protein